MNWLKVLPLLAAPLTVVISVFAGEMPSEWGAKFNSSLEKCGEKIDHAYPPLHLSRSALDLQTLSVSQGQKFLVNVRLSPPREGVEEIFWIAKDLESAQAFVDVLKTGTFKSLLIDRASKSAHKALNHHKIFLLLALSFGGRDPKHDETLRKMHQFIRDLENCPTPNLIKIFNPCLRCPIKKIENGTS